MPDPQPLQSTSAAKEPVIHVIPEQFYGMAVRAQISAPANAPAAPGAPAAVPQAPGGARPGGAPEPSGSKSWIIIPVIALLVLAGLGTAAYFLFLKPKKATPPAKKSAVSIETPKKEEPKPVPEPEPAPAPVPEPEPIPEPEPPPPPEPATSTPPIVAPSEPTNAPDADNDGVSDPEEALYGTDKDKSDSDADGFSDAVEIVNLYNPAGFKPTRLADAGLVETFISTVGKFEMLYPSKWVKTERAGGEAVFTNPEEEPVAVSIEENPNDQSVLDWYLSQNPNVSPLQVQPFFTKSGLEGVRSPDGLTAYIAGGRNIFVLAYATGLKESATFRSTFTMMVNSFMLKP
jgi:hypothetical protein